MHYKVSGSLIATTCGLTVGDWSSDWTKVDCAACVARLPTNKKSREAVGAVMERVFEECRALRDAGQAEYAHRDENAFANFERVAERLGISRERVLMVYLEKHIDGIHSRIAGHKSQRENVRGRINDVIVYLCLLRAMADDAAL